MSEKSGETQIMFAIGIIVLLVWIFWYFFHAEITAMVGWTRYGYLWVVDLVTDKYNPYTVAMERRLDGQLPLSWGNIERVSVVLGDIMKWPVALLLSYYLYWMLMITPKRKFQNKFNLEGLLKIQAKCWPIISPIVNFSPLNATQRVPGSPVPAELPPFAESLSPEEWVAWCRMPVRDGVPDKEDVRAAMTRQLGPKWEGLKGLREHHKALIAAFALRGAQKRTESDTLLGEIATCWDIKTGLRLTPPVQAKIDSVLRNKEMMVEALKAAGKHAYRTTALLGLLRWARDQGGVLAPASFLWLRAEDRGLWYPLNNLGRRSYHAEATGAMAHYMAENIAGRALAIPRVDTAIPALIDYLADNQIKIPSLADAPVKDNAKLKMS